MGSETNTCKRANGRCLAPLSCGDGPCKYSTPNPTADGEADFAELERYIRSEVKSVADRGNALVALGNIRALRARPALPADVQAVVERVRRFADELAQPTSTSGENAMAADIRTLLAHLQRQEG